MKQVIFNRETLKIELHFDKADYTALSDDEKARVKRTEARANDL